MILDDIYYGEVVNNDDPLKIGRIQVKVRNVFEDIPEDRIPWCNDKYGYALSHDVPANGDVVKVTFKNNSIYYPEWIWHKNTRVSSELNSFSSTVLIDKDLSKYGLDGYLKVYHTDENGFNIELNRDSSSSVFTIRKDNTVLLKNGKTDKVIHISDKSISIGSEEESSEPGVLGDTNEKMLNNLNDFVNDLSQAMSTGLKSLSAVASSTPYTAHLTSSIQLLQKQIDAVTNKWYESNKNAFPDTKSKIVTLD